MNTTRRQILKTVPALAAASLSPAFAQGGYPNKPLQLIVPFATGGGNDILARIVAAPLSGILGQPVVVDNKSGAGGNIGAQFVARSAPDGHTLLLATNTLTLNPFLIKSLPFDISKDLSPVTLIANQPIVVVVNPSVPAKNIRELVAYLKANPGKVFYASPGNGTPHHFATELFKQVTGVQMTHVPYRGASPALTDLIAGQVQVMFASVISALPFIKDKRVRALATAEGRRIFVLKDLPTVKESGYPAYESTIWAGIMTAGGTPPAITQRLSEAIRKAVAIPEVASQLLNAGFEVSAGGPEVFDNLIHSDLQQFAKVAKAAGILPE
ncbi:Bug family tripartite tricarboxylate transporter substrate binding protein [Polaromonas sp.]|uniref:Bug family tripartite tricarboxylate transporter substrate binding protein n=1 Tax=Polaromonas sp. TaxID=1869339 RepID=UPI00352A216E